MARWRALYIACESTSSSRLVVGARDLEADVEDRAAHDQADRVKARLGDEQELVDAQVRGVQALAVLLQPLAPGLRNALE